MSVLRAVDRPGDLATRPLVSIGMPVYNGARHLPEALDSCLKQTLEDFELIISDNASTDDTSRICEAYARRDQRIRYIRQPRNIGAPRNWNVVVHEARGEFFKWASGNDYLAPTMLSLCTAAMSREPGAVLCYGHTGLVAEDGTVTGVYDRDLDLAEDRPSARFARLRERLAMNNAQQGVMRTAVLRQTGLDRLYPGGDLALMAELALYGRFRLLPEVLLFRRQGAGAVAAMRTPAEVQRMYNPDARRPMKLVRGRFHWDHMRSVARAGIPLAEKIRALATTVRYARWDRVDLGRELSSLFRHGAS
ncbi:MAG TPA: glycosyltransferase family 2 protein [Methylomirabilota bacterium]|nr:glycosyltransferase family 2 protein [Methylomirabilota bacterium]